MVLIIGVGFIGICILFCVMLKKLWCIIVCEWFVERIWFVCEYYFDVLVIEFENCRDFVFCNSDYGGVDVVLEVVGFEEIFCLVWECVCFNVIVIIVVFYDKFQFLFLFDMYGKNLIFKIGGVDGCDCVEIFSLIE